MGRSSILKARDGQRLMAIATETTLNNVLDYAQERENEMSEEFSAKVNALKQMTIETGDEVIIQEKILQWLDNDVDKRSGCQGKTKGTFFVIKEGNDNYFFIYFILFSIFLFFWGVVLNKFNVFNLK